MAIEPQDVVLEDARALVLDVMGALGVTQAEMARRLEITPASVSQTLSPDRAQGMTIATLRRYLGVLGFGLHLRLVGGKLAPIAEFERKQS